MHTRHNNHCSKRRTNRVSPLKSNHVSSRRISSPICTSSSPVAVCSEHRPVRNGSKSSSSRTGLLLPRHVPHKTGPSQQFAQAGQLERHERHYAQARSLERKCASRVHRRSWRRRPSMCERSAAARHPRDHPRSPKSHRRQGKRKQSLNSKLILRVGSYVRAR